MTNSNYKIIDDKIIFFSKNSFDIELYNLLAFDKELNSYTFRCVYNNELLDFKLFKENDWEIFLNHLTLCSNIKDIVDLLDNDSKNKIIIELLKQ